MSIDSIDHVAGEPRGRRAASGVNLDLVVPPAMLAVAAACALAGYLHLGLAPELAAAIGLVMFCIMLLGHVVLRPGDDPRLADDEPNRSPSPAVAGLERASPALGDLGAQVAAARNAASADPAPSSEPSRFTMRTSRLKRAPVPAVTDDPIASPPEQHQPGDAKAAFRPLTLELPTVEPDTVTESAVGAAIQALRPTMIDSVTAELPDDPPGAGNLGDTPRGNGPLAEADRIEHLMKRLAGEIRAGMTTAEPPLDGPQHAGLSSNEADAAAAEAEAEGRLASAVDALLATVEAMRAGSAPVAQAATAAQGSIGAAGPVTPTPADVRLAAVAEALAAERAEVFLEPILALGEGTARHFEISVRLRTADGDEIDRQQAVADIRGAGLLPLLDALGVRQSAGFALRLERRGRDGNVFSEVAGASLESPRFIADVAGRHAQGIAHRLVLAFEQEEVRALGPAQMSALGELNRLGFRFALNGLNHLDMDFEALEDVGFEYVKLDARVFAEGLEFGGTEVPASDLCRYFDDLGLDVIVGHIDDEAMRGHMMALGVGLGQGALFGAARPVQIGPLDGMAGAAA